MAKEKKTEKKEPTKVSEKVSKRVKSKTTYTQSLKNIAETSDVPVSFVGRVLKGFGEELCRVLVDQGHFRFASFGSFNVKILPPRTARNPKTGATIKVGERKKIRFRAGSGVVSRVCGVAKPPAEEDTI